MENYKKYICWYAYSGHETEGNVNLEEPMTLQAKNKSHALYKYICYTAFKEGKEPYYKTFSEHDKNDYSEGGWGYCVRELHPDESVGSEQVLLQLYLSGGYDK